MITKRSDKPFFTDPIDHKAFKELQKIVYTWAIDKLYETPINPGTMIFDDAQIIDTISKTKHPERHKLKMALELFTVLQTLIVYREKGMTKTEMLKYVLTSLYNQKL